MKEAKNNTHRKVPQSGIGGASGGTTMDRKEFFNSIMRYGIVGGFVLLTGFLLLKRKVTLENTCTEDFACKSCKKHSKCTLPEKV